MAPGMLRAYLLRYIKTRPIVYQMCMSLFSHLPSNDVILENIYRETFPVPLETMHLQVGIAAEAVLAVLALYFRFSHTKYAHFVLHIHHAAACIQNRC